MQFRKRYVTFEEINELKERSDVNNNKIEILHPNTSKLERFLLNILQNKKKVSKLLTLGIAFALILTLSYYMLHKTKTKNYSTSKESLVSSRQSISKAELKKFKKIAKDFPTLQPMLDGVLAQEYTNLGQLGVAQNLFTRLETRQKAPVENLQAFNEITFLIEEQKYKDALDKGYALKEMLKNNSHLQTLYITQLLRLIKLEEKVGHSEQRRLLLSELQGIEEGYKDVLQLGHLNLEAFLNHHTNLRYEN
ncbi:MAG: hypothetical protein S4CHLAM7_09980 [Chlamydiae bacterium]|nr:hypothetical protein [Chlamydiota bacterium]